MSSICDKEVLFFGADSRETSQLLYLLLTVHKHDLLGIKNRKFCLVENDQKGKNGLKYKNLTSFCSFLKSLDVYSRFLKQKVNFFNFEELK
jgi:hypothetical protein